MPSARLTCATVAVVAATATPADGAAQARPSAGPQRQLVVDVAYDRPAHSEEVGWGAGVEYQLTWGGERAPLQIGTALGLDFERERPSGQRRVGLDADLTVQPGGWAPLAPYAGVGASAVRLWAPGEAARVRPGLEGLVGLQFTPRPWGALSAQAELRHGYVRGEPHSTSARAGVVLTL